ncbi:hypothetical protein ALP24_04613 [Pseudomonas syringae pv. aptata]|uniref:Uncharacterized protein n=3 Tax=Pseudomonas syringae group TaxID=136849 RepID=A0AB74AAC7_PSESX|nr:hypothetical protein ALQ98_04758 [Pseudomonas syringae pv. lapsa]RMM29874.1 hypothetical protein ALQ82_05421 [Pseudomonas syringae pv. pisi]RMU72767.1 hypothetical protein ALP24_04613 [Pseudomonas syringae pv. aptata]RMU91585.1 hypothetical protein ALP21_05090 [Pseudomonas savastanoi pv. phaseolicola]RMV56949.1 AsmA protein [Pseudomonas syringae pv. pisi]
MHECWPSMHFHIQIKPSARLSVEHSCRIQRARVGALFSGE